jgi:hypothetical protein
MQHVGFGGENYESAEQHKLMDIISQGMIVSRMFEEGLLSLFCNHFFWRVLLKL